MSTLEILFGIAIPIAMVTITLTIFCLEVYISWQFGRPVKKRKPSDKEEKNNDKIS